jgi:phage-related protein (TIGR01555 family)
VNYSKHQTQHLLKDLKSKLDSYAFTGLVSQDLGIGTADDKLTSFDDYTFKYIAPSTARRIYANGDVLQNMVDVPAMDATREGFELTSEYDEFDASKIMTKRLQELCIDDVLRDHLENIATYSRGSMVMPIVDEYLPLQSHDMLSINLIRRVEAINVLTEDDFTFIFNTTDPFKASYLRPMQTMVRGAIVDPTRFQWGVYKYFARENIGVSLLSKVLLACLALRVTNWSLASVMLEVQNKVLKVSNLDNYAQQDGGVDLRGNTATQRDNVLTRIKRWMTTQKMMVLDKDDDFTRQMYSASGTKEATDFFWEYLSAITGYPKATLIGQPLGAITAADVDARRYAQKVRSSLQFKYCLPVLRYVINLLKFEQSGEFYKKFGMRAADIHFDIDFKQIWQANEQEQAQIKLTDSQRGQVDVQNGVRSADQVRAELYPDLDEFEFPVLPENEPSELDLQKTKSQEQIEQAQ